MTRTESERARALLQRADADLAEAPFDEEPLDRAAVRDLLERLRGWAAAYC